MKLICLRNAGLSMEWSRLKGELLRSKPQCAPSMPSMYRFCLKFGGNTLLEKTESRIKMAGQCSRNLGSDVYEVLSQDPRPAHEDPLVYLRHALLIFLYAGPEKVLSLGDLKKIHAKDARATAGKANRLLIEVDGLFEKASPKDQQETAVEFIGLSHRLALMAVEKKHPKCPTPATMEGAVCGFARAFKQKTGKTLTDKYDGYVEVDVAKPCANPKNHWSPQTLGCGFILFSNCCVWNFGCGSQFHYGNK